MQMGVGSEGSNWPAVAVDYLLLFSGSSLAWGGRAKIGWGCFVGYWEEYYILVYEEGCVCV